MTPREWTDPETHKRWRVVLAGRRLWALVDEYGNSWATASPSYVATTSGGCPLAPLRWFLSVVKGGE